MCCSAKKCVAVAVCRSALQCATVCCSAKQCVAACCSVLQCTAVYCSVLQSVANWRRGANDLKAPHK